MDEWLVEEQEYTQPQRIRLWMWAREYSSFQYTPWPLFQLYLNYSPIEEVFPHFALTQSKPTHRMYAHEWHPWPASSAFQVIKLYSNLFENIFKLNLNEISAFGTRKCTAPNGFHISYIFHYCWLLPALILLGRQRDRRSNSRIL